MHEASEGQQYVVEVGGGDRPRRRALQDLGGRCFQPALGGEHVGVLRAVGAAALLPVAGLLIVLADRRATRRSAAVPAL